MYLFFFLVLLIFPRENKIKLVRNFLKTSTTARLTEITKFHRSRIQYDSNYHRGPDPLGTGKLNASTRAKHVLTKVIQHSKAGRIRPPKPQMNLQFIASNEKKTPDKNEKRLTRLETRGK